MKNFFCLIAIFFLSFTHNIFADAPTTRYTQQVISLDKNHDNKITLESIANGTDDIFVRRISKSEIDKSGVHHYFMDDKNNYYLPLIYADLPKADSNSDRRIDNKDPIFSQLFIARLDHGKIAALLPLKDSGITALVLPAAIPDPSGKVTHLQAVSRDGSLVLVDSVEWKY